ncbi:MAG: type II toxin-antitoxin system VapC family toxin, partial [Lautropia sp.]|nr:type II toxin-antitoxin system VapC family toxin [Lautropia sp.]
MKLLLDTHLVLWAASAPKRLSPAARLLLRNPENELVVSVASFWEIVIKRGLGRDDFKVEPARLRRGLRDNGWKELALTSDHALAVDLLPPLHRDPFDRMLVAQSNVESI